MFLIFYLNFQETAAPPAIAAGKGASAKKALKDFAIQYAKSGASTCQACEEKIPKGDVRISKKDYDSERALMYSKGNGLVSLSSMNSTQ
jgi:hypothetical protein